MHDDVTLDHTTDVPPTNCRVTALQPLDDGRFWYDIAPVDAIALTLEPDQAPLNEAGEPCPWPWDPQQLDGAPLGQYHCGYCGAMVMAGMRHLDYRERP